MKCDTTDVTNFNPCCFKPPGDMVAWYPLDDAMVDPLSHELVYNNRGAPFNGTFAGPGMVKESAHFDGIDDYYEAPDASQINFGDGNFSIDAWVLTSPAPGAPIILDKRTQVGQVVTGYSLFTSNGNLAFQLADGSFTNYVSPGPRIDDGLWHHVAVTIERNNVNGGIFYVDGVNVGTFNPTSRSGSVNNSGVLRLGALSSFNSSNWPGRIDEVELFDRVLFPHEVFGIFDAGPYGKCRDTCHTNWDVPFCQGQDTVTTTATICNNGTAPATYSLSLAGLPASVPPCADIDGPTSFTILDPMPITVNPGECASVNIAIDRPAGMTAAGLVACFETVWKNDTTGSITRCTGSVQDRRDYSAKFDNGLPPIFSMVPGETTTLPVIVSDGIGGDGGTLEIQVITMRSDMSDADPIISLDGLPPGEAVTRTIKIPPDGDETFNVEVQLTDHEPFAFYDVILMIAVEDGSFQASDSHGFRSLPPTTGCSNALGDVNSDGNVDLLDVSPFIDVISEGGFECTADCNQDGVVDLLDVAPFIEILAGG